MNSIIERVEHSQLLYLKDKKRDYLKEKSQFFTPYETALKMVSTIKIEMINSLDKVKILEPSAGCGILIATLIEHIILNSRNVKQIFIDAYEDDKELANILKKNLLFMKNELFKKKGIILDYKVINSNFILYNDKKWNKKNAGKYNLIISNPPYRKINQTSKEALNAREIIHGQPNIYTLFIAMSLNLLSYNGIYVVLSPRNYLTGEYSKKLRKYIFNSNSLIHIHSFSKRNMFSTVNQEVIISTYIKNKELNDIIISFDDCVQFKVDFESIVYDKERMSVVVPKYEEDINVLKKFDALRYSLDELNYKVSVGPVVQFRNEEYLSKKKYSKEFAPLLICNDVQSDDLIIYEQRINKRKTHNKSISTKSKKLIKNSNYLLLRKVSAMDDNSLITCAVINKEFFKHQYLGLDNNLLYFSSSDKSLMSLEECYGLYCFINCQQFSRFYSIINGTHTINITDFNKIKFPEKKIIIRLGNKLIKSNDYSKNNCTRIINEFIF